MSITQVSKIQMRTGDLADLPQLSTGELGWAADQKRLYIGNDPETSNTEVLTEFSPIVGKSGVSGWSGFSGWSGYSGLNGAATYSGYSGFSGFSGIGDVTTSLYTISATGGQPRTVQSKLGDTISVMDFGADPTGAVSSSTAFDAAWAYIKTRGGTILIPKGTYTLSSTWIIDIDTTAPHNYEIIGYGATIETTSAVTGWAFRVINSFNNYGLKIEGLAFNQRLNSYVNGAVVAAGTTNLNLINLSAEIGTNKAGWTFIQLEDLTPGNGDTACFWTIIDGCKIRVRDGTETIVGTTTATTQLTLGSDLMTVTALTPGSDPLAVGFVVGDYPIPTVNPGGLSLLPGGTIITSQVSGTPGGAGVYKLSSTALGTTLVDEVYFQQYSACGIRMSGSQNATKITNCTFASVVDAIRLDPGSNTPQPGWPNGDIGIGGNGIRIERNDFEGVNNGIKINTDSPAVIMPTGIMASHNRFESGYCYFNIGSNTQCIADAATFAGSIAANTNILTVTSITGTIVVGQPVLGTGLYPYPVIQPFGTGGTTGTGSTGTYAIGYYPQVGASTSTQTWSISGVRSVYNHSHPPMIGLDYTVQGSSSEYILNPNNQIVYSTQPTYYGASLNQVGGPTDYIITMEQLAGQPGRNLYMRDFSGRSTYANAHFVMGQQHYWTDQSGNFRSKLGLPNYDLDGSLVGQQGTAGSAPPMDNLFVNPFFNLYGTNSTSIVWGVSGGPPVGCSVTQPGVVGSYTPPSACPNNPTGQAAKIQTLGTFAGHGLVVSLNSSQLTNGDTISCGIWVLSPSLSAQKAYVLGDNGAGGFAVVGSNTVANTWQYLTWSQPVTNTASAAIYVTAGTGATFTATVPYGSSQMTVTGVTGTISAGAILVGGPDVTGQDIAPFGGSVLIVSQASGVPGGAGVYNLSSPLTRQLDSVQMNTITALTTNTIVWAGGLHYNLGSVKPTYVSDSFADKDYTWNVTQAGVAQAVSSVNVHRSTAIPAGGTTGAGLTLSSTANFGVFFGSGAPTLSAAKGSMYLRSDGTTTNNRAYINTDGGTTWTALITAA